MVTQGLQGESEADYLERTGSQVVSSPAVGHYRSIEVLSRRENATLEKCVHIENGETVAVKAFNIVALKGKSRRTLKRSKVAELNDFTKFGSVSMVPVRLMGMRSSKSEQSLGAASSAADLNFD